MWEFTITIESLDYYSYGNYGSGISSGGGAYGTPTVNQAITGLRAQIKKIAREHLGKNGRKGAVFERGGAGEGIVPDEPLLRNLTEDAPEGADAAVGKWRIPLGAYHTLMTYLQSKGNNNNVIPGEIAVRYVGTGTDGQEELCHRGGVVDEECEPGGVFGACAVSEGGRGIYIESEWMRIVGG